MYRLLIVTEKQSVREMFEGMSGWEVMGFKQPRLRATTEEALACMEKHHIDAIAMDQGDVFADLDAHVEKNCPTMLRFDVEESPEEQLKTIRLLDRLLNQIRADHSNNQYDENNALQYTRDRQMKAVLSGLVPTRKEVNNRLRMLRCPEQGDVPCIVARLGLDEEDPFLTERWHYGSDRLEVALRNFFGGDQPHMLVHVAVVSQDEVRVLCYPCADGQQLSEESVRSFIEEVAQQVENYMGLRMKVLEVQEIPGLCAFARECSAN